MYYTTEINFRFYRKVLDGIIKYTKMTESEAEEFRDLFTLGLTKFEVYVRKEYPNCDINTNGIALLRLSKSQYERFAELYYRNSNAPEAEYEFDGLAAIIKYYNTDGKFLSAPVPLMFIIDDNNFTLYDFVAATSYVDEGYEFTMKATSLNGACEMMSICLKQFTVWNALKAFFTKRDIISRINDKLLKKKYIQPRR